MQMIWLKRKPDSMDGEREPLDRACCIDPNRRAGSSAALHLPFLCSIESPRFGEIVIPADAESIFGREATKSKWIPAPIVARGQAVREPLTATRCPQSHQWNG